MIKLFKSKNKINFVDDNNAFVGFDTSMQYAERFGWFVIASEYDILLAGKGEGDVGGCEELEDWVFDTESEVIVDTPGVREVFNLDNGGAVFFPLRNTVETERKGMLVLTNAHNGYYSHGWEFGKLNVEKEGRI